MRSPICRTVLLLGLVLAIAGAGRAETAPSGPAISAPVEALHEDLLTLMQTGTSSPFAARYALLDETIGRTFNLPLISRVVLGRHWRTLDEAEQARFSDLFRRLTVATYVQRFADFDGHRFVTGSIKPLRKHRHLVKTTLTVPGDEPVSLDYIVQQTDSDWKIISVIANGVNDLSLKRAEYAAVIRAGGYAGLVGNIEQKINDLQAE